MSIVVVSGSGGLVGSEAARYFGSKGLDVIGIDNNMRQVFFGPEASTAWNVQALQTSLPRRYRHLSIDIRDKAAVDRVFAEYADSIKLVIHAAAQPSHDWAAQDPVADFTINANGTLNLLEATRRSAPQAAFVFTSTNKVYGDQPNRLPFVETSTRWEIGPDHPYQNGIPEGMSIDACLHSLFGASKVAADILVQEYGRYFGMNTVVFRGGCLTGPHHAGARLHGFLAYLVRCAITETPYVVFGYKGKQVRDNIHSWDLVSAFDEYFKAPRPGAVYNIGGGRFSNCSILEAIAIAQNMMGRELQWTYSENSRIGDHIWWISDCSKFQRDYPEWTWTRDVSSILREIYEFGASRWGGEGRE